MLDVSLHSLSFSYPHSSFALRDVSAVFPKSTHTAIVGSPGSGASTVLKLIAGLLRPDGGEIRIGRHVVNRVKPPQRPVLHATNAIEIPRRWSVRHALVAAVRQRTLDRVDRQREYELAISKWELEGIIDRRISTLSSSEETLVHLARIELLRPGILLADRLLESLNVSARAQAADNFYRMLRVIGATVVSAPASTLELGLTDAVLVLDGGSVVQHGPPAHVYSKPSSLAAAQATGNVNAIPVVIRGNEVESVIGAWTVSPAPFQGAGIALVRPHDFVVAAPGEDSDVIFGVEEASFVEGRWLASGLLSGALTLLVALPREVAVHKGKLLALRYDGSRFPLIRGETEPPMRSIPSDMIPPLRETR